MPNNARPFGSRQAIAAFCLAACIAFPHGAPAAAPAQRGQPSARQDAGYLAEAGDRELTSRFDPRARTTTVALTVAPLGPDGSPSSLSLTFSATFPGRTPPEMPPAIDVRAHVGPLSDSRVARTTSLDIELRRDEREPVRLFYMGSALGYGGFTPPGDQLPLVRFTLGIADVLAIGRADGVAGRALGFPIEFTQAQLTAIRLFAGLLVPEATSREGE